MRTILHSDCNNFYASVETVYDPSLRGKPVAVCGDPSMRHGIVLAKNGPAKACGIITGEAVHQAVKKCPTLTVVLPHHRLYLRFSRMMREIYRSYTDRVEPFGLDESWLDVSDSALSGAEIAARIRRRAKEELGITVSVGISFNKVFAKLASDIRKPDATTLITPDNYREKIWPLPVGSLLFVGSATQKKLAAHGMRTVGDVALASPYMLKEIFGKGGEMLGAYARGQDASPVLRAGEEDELKSIGNSTTTPQDIADIDEARQIIYLLADSVATRLRAHGLMGRTVAIWVRDTALSAYERQTRLSLPCDLSCDIAACAVQLLRASYDWALPLRSLGVRVCDLVPTETGRQVFALTMAAQARFRALENGLDEIRQRFGSAAVQRAMLVARGNPLLEQSAQPFGARREGA